jgi:tetratricopeptide (TPR) repeat protein
VQATIASRIDRLSFEDKMVLRSASAFGEVVDLRMLGIVTNMQGKELRGSLDRLRNLALLSEAAALPANSCRFRHALTRDVAYNSLAAWRKTTLHQRIVQAIEEVGDVQSTEVLALVAAHALDGELWSKAFRCWSELADRAMAQSASGDALAACRNAECALRHFEQSDDIDRRKLDLFFLQIDAHFARGDHAEVSEHIDKAYVLAERLGDQPKLIRALSLKAFRSWLSGEPAEAIKAGRRAYKIACNVESKELRVNTAVRLGIYLLARGDYASATEPFEWSIEAIPESQISERFGLVSIAAAAARSALARTLGELLQFDRGRVLASEAMSIAERYGHPFTLLYVTQEVGILYLRAGDLGEAARVLSIGHRLALTMPVNLLRPAVMSELGATLVESGQLAEGMDLLERSLDCARSLRLRPQFGQQLGYLARGHLLAGDTDRARALAQEALECTLAYNERGDEAWIRYLLAEIAEQSDPAEGRSMLAEVRRLAKRRGYATLVKMCQEKLGPKDSSDLEILPFAGCGGKSEQQVRRTACARSTGN